MLSIVFTYAQLLWSILSETFNLFLWLLLVIRRPGGVSPDTCVYVWGCEWVKGVPPLSGNWARVRGVPEIPYCCDVVRPPGPNDGRALLEEARNRLRRALAPSADGVGVRAKSGLIGQNSRVVSTSQTGEVDAVSPGKWGFHRVDGREWGPQYGVTGGQVQVLGNTQFGDGGMSVSSILEIRSQDPG